MTGTTIAQAIPVAITPILTRIYTPEDFGVLALFIAIVSIFGTIATGRYELAIMLPKKDEDAINIFALGFIITTILSSILLILTIIFNNYFVNLLNNKEISMWLYFIPLAVFFMGFFNILNYFNIRRKNYKDIANATIIKSIAAAIIQLSIGFIKSGASGLVSGQIISQLFANMRLLKNILKDKILMSKIKKVKIIALAKRYKDFPKHNAPAALFDIGALQMPFLFLTKLFNETIVGFYFLAARLIFLPSALIGTSISQVFFQTISNQKNNNEKCMPLLKNTILKLSAISFLFTLLFFIFSPLLFKIIFGAEWEEAGEIARYLSIIFFIRFIVSPVSSVFSVSGFIARGAMWKYIYFFSTLTLFLFTLIFKVKLYTFLLLFVIHEIILYLLYLYFIVKSVRQLDKGQER